MPTTTEGTVASGVVEGRLAVLATGQQQCFDQQGLKLGCRHSGQDGEWRRGIAPPTPRFRPEGGLVRDCLSGLVWPRDAGSCELPLMWQEALDVVALLNAEQWLGHADWRMPGRSELLSLLSFGQTRPPLPADHPFINLFAGWYWSSTSAACRPDHAWYLNMDGGRLFYGGKDQSFMLWPVRGKSLLSLRRQHRCYNSAGTEVACRGSGQDGAFAGAVVGPEPRFRARDGAIQDRWTGLDWLACDEPGEGPVNWDEALAWVKGIGSEPERPWRLPNINELESLVDYDHGEPATPPALPLSIRHDAYWSSTTSLYEPDWAWALYLDKGAMGVGQKKGRHYHVMAVR